MPYLGRKQSSCVWCLFKGLFSWWGGKKRAPHEVSSCAVQIRKTHQFIPICWLTESGSVIYYIAHSKQQWYFHSLSFLCHYISYQWTCEMKQFAYLLFYILVILLYISSAHPMGNGQCESLYSFWTFSILQLFIFGPVNFCHFYIKRPLFQVNVPYVSVK